MTDGNFTGRWKYSTTIEDVGAGTNTINVQLFFSQTLLKKTVMVAGVILEVIIHRYWFSNFDKVLMANTKFTFLVLCKD